MRTFLDRLYLFSGVASAICLVLICLIVVAQVSLRFADNIVYLLTGDRYGLMVPSAAEFSGFFLAAASFLALAYTLRHGAHIRVNLFIRNVRGRARDLIEIFCLTVAAGISIFFAWNTFLMVVDSWQFHEVSFGIVPVPLWIPQSAMLAGLVILSVALLDDLAAVLRGRPPSYRVHEEAEASLAEEIEREI